MSSNRRWTMKVRITAPARRRRRLPGHSACALLAVVLTLLRVGAEGLHSDRAMQEAGGRSCRQAWAIGPSAEAARFYYSTK